jgi:hypothetical protein
VTEREYIEALVNGMRTQMTEAEERARTLNPRTARQFNEEQRARGLALLDSLDPPAELRELHGRLREMAARPVGQSEDEDQEFAPDIIRLVSLAEKYGLELVPGMSARELVESMTAGSREWAPLDDTWEARLRRSLADDGRDDIDGIVERMRMLRER